jgi:IS5 family transposase
LIDVLFDRTIHGPNKPRTYREEAHIKYLFISKKKVRRRKELRKAIGQQLRYLRRNLSTIKKLLSKYPVNPLKEREQAYYETIKKVFEQQDQMYSNCTHSVPNRIESIQLSHIRPIVLGKKKAKVEFDSKINVSLVNGYGFVDHLSWDAFNEGRYLMKSVELYKKRHGFYPAEVMVDQIYGTLQNRRQLKDLNIKIVGRQLGRPPKIPTMILDPGDRNPIEGKFGQGKRDMVWD